MIYSGRFRTMGKHNKKVRMWGSTKQFFTNPEDAKAYNDIEIDF